jgi:hypothetical protein
MGPKKGVTVTEALTRNLAPLLEMKVNQDGIPTALEPGDILSFLHEMEQYNAQRTDVMERALILSCMSGDVRNYLAQYENLRMASYTENEEEQKGALLSYDRWDTNRKEERQTCLNWDERIADALRKEFGLVQLGDESCKEPRKEFGRRGASDHSTHCDALMRFCNALKVTGFAVDVASIKDLSEEEAKQLYDWMAKGLAKPNGNWNGIKKNCPGKQSPRQGTIPPPPPRTTATTAVSSVSAVSGGSAVDISNLSPQSRGMVESVARSLARK